MPSFSSRLGSWLRRAPKKTKTGGLPTLTAAAPSSPTSGGRDGPEAQASGGRSSIAAQTYRPQTPGSRRTGPAGARCAGPCHTARPGLRHHDDIVAVALTSRSHDSSAGARLRLDAVLLLEREDGGEQIGAAAVNMSAPIHSIKLDLPTTQQRRPPARLAPSKIAHRIIEERSRGPSPSFVVIGFSPNRRTSLRSPRTLVAALRGTFRPAHVCGTSSTFPG